MGTKDEMNSEINIVSLLYRLLKHWRLLIISMIIGGILLNGLGYLRSKRAAISVQQTIDDYQDKLASGTYDEKGNTIMSIPEFEKNLTERQINEVNNLVSTYKMYQGPYSDMVEYINSSLLMQIDPKKAPTYIVQYSIDTHYEVEYPKIEKKDYTEDILNSVMNNLFTNDNLAEIAEDLSSDNETIEASYIQELITANIISDTISITIHGRSKNECEIIVKNLKEKLPTIFKRLQSQYVDFDYTLVSDSYFEAYDRTIQTSQQARADELNNIYKTTQGMIQNLTDDQKSYFYALLNNESTISVELPVESDSSEEEIDPSTLEVPPVNKFSIKYTILGVFTGIAVTCAGIIGLTLIRGRIISNEDLESSFGISQLGVWRVSPPPKGVFSFIDRLLIRLLDKRGEQNTPEEGLDRIVTDITLSASNNEWHTIYLATTSNTTLTTDALSTLSDKLNTKIKNVNFGNTIYHDSETLKILSQSDAVVLVEHTDISRISEVHTEYNLCKRYKLPILGYVILK